MVAASYSNSVARHSLFICLVGFLLTATHLTANATTICSSSEATSCVKNCFGCVSCLSVFAAKGDVDCSSECGRDPCGVCAAYAKCFVSVKGERGRPGENGLNGRPGEKVSRVGTKWAPWTCLPIRSERVHGRLPATNLHAWLPQCLTRAVIQYPPVRIMLHRPSHLFSPPPPPPPLLR